MENEIKIEDYKKFLPLGTVVMLKNGTKRIMITGFCCVDTNNKEKVYDYCGCMYPEGTVGSDTNLIFNHDQIKKIYALGYSDKEDKEYKEKIELALKELNME